MDSMKLFWGLVLLVIGGLFIARNLGYIDSAIWIDVLALWPLILVAFGLKLIVRNEKVLAICYLLMVIFATSFVVLSASKTETTTSGTDYFRGGMMNRQTYNENLLGTFDSTVSKNQKVHISTGAAKVTVASLPADAPAGTLYKIKTQDMGKVTVKKTESGDTIALVIEESSTGLRLGRGMVNREIEIYLSPLLATTLELDSGASKLSLDFSGLQVAKSNLSIGASSGDIYLGTKATRQQLTLDSSASKIVFHFPATLGMQASFDSGLNTINTEFAPGMTKTGDTYSTKDFSTATAQAVITGSVGASSVRFQTE